MIDVIIPAYNAHKTIEKTLYSILMQSYKDKVKVYIVDDKSDYNYSEIVDKFKNYLNIEELTLDKNQGPGVARNYGIKNSNSEYIIFIDSDDIFYNHYSIEILYKNIINNYDLVVSSFIEEISNNTYITHNNKKIWNHGKIYRRKYLLDNKIEFINTSNNEDMYFNFLIFMSEAKINYISDITYIWKNNHNSLTRKNNHEYNHKGLSDYNKVINQIIDTSLKRNIKKEMIASVLFFGMLQMYYTYLSYYENNNKLLMNEVLKATKYNIHNYLKYKKYLLNEEKARILSLELEKYVGNNLELFFLPKVTFLTFIDEVLNYE